MIRSTRSNRKRGGALTVLGIILSMGRRRLVLRSPHRILAHLHVPHAPLCAPTVFLVFAPSLTPLARIAAFGTSPVGRHRLLLCRSLLSYPHHHLFFHFVCLFCKTYPFLFRHRRRFMRGFVMHREIKATTTGMLFWCG
ncbi:hypothetical protein AVEN_59747-1 [Araneus ventricosus]|uniref:Uncharacterized protein n=1 Tax=Araneus ventricosus TaxID=182803 RepID=A0A4Y2BPD4_ARAVE|nr:hypothetical protein AVEN_59747-1 [Araneus ventricosus]